MRCRSWPARAPRWWRSWCGRRGFGPGDRPARRPRRRARSLPRGGWGGRVHERGFDGLRDPHGRVEILEKGPHEGSEELRQEVGDARRGAEGGREGGEV